MNKYAYSRNNPINLYDPGGKMFGFIGRKYIARQVVKYAFSNPIGAAHSATSMIPYVGDAMDVSEVVSGKNAFTGEQLSTGERVVTGVAALLPIVGGAVVRNVGGEVVKGASNIIEETLQGSGPFTSKFTPSVNQMLDDASEFLGGGYKEMGQNGSGVFRSADDTRQFRIDNSSLNGSHDPHVPHGHLETLFNGEVDTVNHIIFKE